MTFDELDHKLPNGFHDMKIYSVEMDYTVGQVKLKTALLIGWPEDPEPEREEYQDANLTLSGVCLYSADPPYPGSPFLPDGKPVLADGSPAEPDHLPTLSALSLQFPDGVSCYRFFVHDWNAFIHIAAKEADISWVGTRPKHSQC